MRRNTPIFLVCTLTFDYTLFSATGVPVGTNQTLLLKTENRITLNYLFKTENRITLNDLFKTENRITLYDLFKTENRITLNDLFHF